MRYHAVQIFGDPSLRARPDWLGYAGLRDSNKAIGHKYPACVSQMLGDMPESQDTAEAAGRTVSLL
jgi:hypothetical protein